MRLILTELTLCSFLICAAGQTLGQSLSATNQYPKARIEHICQNIQTLRLSRISGNIDDQVQMLLDADPWVRAYAACRLMSDTTFTEAWRSAGLPRVDPWNDSRSDRDVVATFLRRIGESPEQIHYREGISRTVRERGNALSMPEALTQLVYFAGQELRKGNRVAADLLVALLDVGIPSVQADALRTLIPRTGFEHTRQDLKRLNPHAVIDREFLSQVTHRFLTWWEANNATFAPEPEPPDLPR